jgi:hypothetical protein
MAAKRALYVLTLLVLRPIPLASPSHVVNETVQHEARQPFLPSKSRRSGFHPILDAISILRPSNPPLPTPPPAPILQPRKPQPHMMKHVDNQHLQRELDNPRLTHPRTSQEPKAKPPWFPRGISPIRHDVSRDIVVSALEEAPWTWATELCVTYNPRVIPSRLMPCALAVLRLELKGEFFSLHISKQERTPSLYRTAAERWGGDGRSGVAQQLGAVLTN